MTHYDPHPEAHDDARSTPSGFTDRRESDFQAPEAPEATPDDSAGAEGASVVEQAARIMSGGVDPCEGALSDAQALADAGLLIPDDWSQRAERVEHYVADLQARLEGQRDEARARVAELEADYSRLAGQNAESIRLGQHSSALYDETLDELEQARARVADLEAEVENWRKAHDWAHEQWAKKRDAAEARACRAEDALQRVESLAAEWERDWEAHIVTGEHGLGYASRKGAAKRIRRALSAGDQTSDATPSDTTTEEDTNA